MARLDVTRTLLKAQASEAAGRFAVAHDAYLGVLAHYPGNPRAQAGVRRIKSALATTTTAGNGAAPAAAAGPAADPPTPVLNELCERHAAGDIEGLAAQLDELEPRHPGSTALLNLRGMVRLHRGDRAGALEIFTQCVALSPDVVASRQNLGRLLFDLGRYDEAVTHLRRLVELAPGKAGNFVSLSHALRCTNRTGEAIEAAQAALKLEPENPAAWFALAIVSEALKDHETAIQCLKRALSKAPGSTLFRTHLARIQIAAGKVSQAERTLDELAPLDLTFNERSQLAYAYRSLGRLEASVDAMRRCLAIKPDSDGLRAVLDHATRSLCDWSRFEADAAHVAALGLDPDADPVSAWGLLCVEDDPMKQFKRSRRSIGLADWVDPRPAPGVVTRRPGRLRVGYFSADLSLHATMLLISGLFREHDRDRFDLSFISYKRTSADKELHNAIRSDDRVLDFTMKVDSEFVDAARELDLDIAVDLKGETADTRMRVFKHGLAPVQIHYLGYPGTTGAPFIDYNIVDETVTPPEHREAYSERLIYMPHCYQANDNQRIVPSLIDTRADHGLPEDALVLCCFNEPYKISPVEFDIWMRVLRERPDAVLWLMCQRETVIDNLRREAQARGVNPMRIVPAKKINVEAHRARLLHADLFVDTFNVNAHTTGSDALWGATPVLTLQGRQFAARVGASLLRAVDLPELIARTPAEYEDKLLSLCADRPRLAALRRHLDENRLHLPLFDTARFTRDFEAGLVAAAERHASGLRPADIRVADLPR